MTEEKKLWRVGESKFLPKSGITQVEAGFPGPTARRHSREERFHRGKEAIWHSPTGAVLTLLTLLVSGDTVVR